MERKANINGTAPNEPATPMAMSKAVEETGTVPPRKGAQARRYLGSGLRFTRHLLEMVVAMFAGIAVLGVALWVLGEPPGYDAHPLVKFVARSYAEFCAIVDLLVGAAILFMA